MKHSLIALAWFAASLAAAQPASAPSAGRFDGAWLVTLVCPNNTEKSAARGYRRQFVAEVKDGALRGESLTETSPGWIRIEGRIGADGNALLDARGRTGDPEFAVNHPAQSSLYAYHVDAHFDAAHGTGRRIEQRVCSFEFDRR